MPDKPDSNRRPRQSRSSPQREVTRTMVKVYASLIRKGLKTLEQVPEIIREDVAVILEDK
ncbi:hypothetical protein GCM10010912_22780 [Paenibacillus albidus]|uniref:Uncharacterized protein n=1 Tax=Paenibacillus albidus TaxID=2041023 RepID=A0A917FFR4_9BACL|nr:hypothetical protein GCM10010912_22780 [Paenibacillus albidus]